MNTSKSQLEEKILLGNMLKTKDGFGIDGKPASIVPVRTTINTGDWFISPNKEWVMLLLESGYFNKYQVVGHPPDDSSKYFKGRKIWTLTQSIKKNDHLDMQDDGNLVLYSNDDSILWASATDDPNRETLGLFLQNNNDLVLYQKNVGWQSQVQKS